MEQAGVTVLFGGTFNPVHEGHAALARIALAKREAGELWVIPSGNPAHKDGEPQLAPAACRLEMCRLAFAGMPGVRVSDTEIRQSGKNYSLRTVRALKAAFPGRAFVFLLGGDSAETFFTWHRYAELLREIPLWAVPRAGKETAPFTEAVRRLTGEGGDVTVLNGRVPDLSSTDIRRRIRAGLPVRGLVHPDVEAYLARNRLYTGEERVG